MKQYITVGKVLSSWGIKGQVKVEPLTDDIRRFDRLNKIYVNRDKEPSCFFVESVTYQKNNFVILKLKNVDTPEQAQELRGFYLEVERRDAVKLPEGRYFICDIIGLEVYSEDGKFLGKVVDVLQTGANDVYIVKQEGEKELLVPAINQVVKTIDIDNNKMIVSLLEGLE